RLGHRGRAHQPQHARGDGAGRPDRGAPARGAGDPLPRRRTHHGAGHRRHDRRPRQRGGGVSDLTEVTAAEEEPAEAPKPSGVRAALRRRLTETTTWTFLILLGIVAGFAALRFDAFATAFNFRNIAVDASGLSVIAVGMTFVIITAGIDLSVGSVLVFSGVIAAKVMLAIGGGGGAIAPGAVARLSAGLAWGVVNGLLITKARVPPLIVTLGTLGMALGSALLITGGIDVRGIPLQLTTTIGIGRVAGVPYVVIIAAVVVTVGAVVLAATRFGRYTYAIGSNAEAARRAGINVDRHLIKVYALSGFLAGMAGGGLLARRAPPTNRRPLARHPGRARPRRPGRHQPVRRHRNGAGHGRGGVHPGHPPERVRDPRGAAVLAAGRGRGRPDRRRLHRPAQAPRPGARREEVGTMRRGWLVGTVALALLLAACGGNDEGGGGTGGGEKQYKLTLIQGVKGDQFYVTMECGAQEAAAAAGASLEVTAPDEFDAALQSPIVRAVTAKKPDAILVAPTDPQAMIPPLTEAKAAGIKLVFVDTTTENGAERAESEIASDNEEGGREAARSLAELTGGKGSVAVINVKPGISTT